MSAPPTASKRWYGIGRAAAGRGLKSGYKTTRTIRQADFAPTVAALLGIPMPADCEGGVVTQILAQ